MVCGDWEAFSEKDYKKILESGYQVEDYEKMYIEQDEIFQSLFLMDEGISPMKAKEVVREIFGDPECGQVFRIKGFLKGRKCMAGAECNSPWADDASAWKRDRMY